LNTLTRKKAKITRKNINFTEE
jgi:hypothetical protein